MKPHTAWLPPLCQLQKTRGQVEPQAQGPESEQRARGREKVRSVARTLRAPVPSCSLFPGSLQAGYLAQVQSPTQVGSRGLISGETDHPREKTPAQ